MRVASIGLAATGVLWLATSPAAAQRPVLERADVEAWLDGFLPSALETADMAGAVVVVIKDDKVLLQKGYGYADMGQKTAIDPERTLFRPGSVSKLFTWTAVMQQVEQGKIELDRDVNAYLDFTIPEDFGKPITMRNLMTHTPGFEEHVKGTFFEYPRTLPSLERYVKDWLPRRMFPPGEVPAYSNYGTALAGYIVQRTSGEDFYDYVDRHILQPLGMQHSTFRQPLPAGLVGDMAKGYDVASRPSGFYRLVGPAPAGSLAASGADMAKFMIAHLQAERTGGGILRPETAQLMHRSIAKALPPLDGFALGFFESSQNGQRIIMHGGDMPGFHSLLSLMPDRGTGLYVCYNSSGKGGASNDLRFQVFQRFMDRYLPTPVPEEPTVSTALEHGRVLARGGPYEASRRSEFNFLTLPGALLGQLNVNVRGDGTIATSEFTGTIATSEFTGFNGEPIVWHEIAPYVWRRVGGKERLAARVVDGRVKAFGPEPYASIVVMQPASLRHSSTWNLPLAVATVAVLALALISWPVVTLVRRHYGRTSKLPAREAKAYRWTRLVALVDLVFLLGWIPISTADEFTHAVNDGRLDVWIALLQAIGLIGVVGSLVALWNAWLTWRGARSRWETAWSTVLAGACLAVGWFAFAFHLINFSLMY